MRALYFVLCAWASSDNHKQSTKHKEQSTKHEAQTLDYITRNNFIPTNFCLRSDDEGKRAL